MGKPRKGSMLVLFGALAASALAADSWSPSPDIGAQSGCAGRITFTWTTCLVSETKTLTATRALDLDTLNGCILIGDTLNNRWPRWTATCGTFAGSDASGTSVDWTAPGIPCQATFRLYENDWPQPIGPDDTGSRDDSETRQDTKTVSVQSG
jgi:hypothetical protein